MTAEQIRNSKEPLSEVKLLQEIAAQLAERNDILRESNKSLDGLIERVNKLLDMGMNYALHQMGIKPS